MFGVFSDLAGAQDWALVILGAGACLAACAAAFGLLRRGRTAGSEPTAASEQKLRERNGRLDAALNNMTQGLCMFDASERIVVLNRRFLEMYKLSPQVVRPGCTFMELLRHRREVGLLETDPERFNADLMRHLATGRSTHLIHQTRDNRFILAHNQPMPGGGWVTTHEDITEQRNAEEEIREQQLKFDAALQNMSQGLCMYDGEGRVIICNQRYRQIYALSEQDVRPGRTLWELLQTRKDRGLLKEPPERYSVPLKAARSPTVRCRTAAGSRPTTTSRCSRIPKRRCATRRCSSTQPSTTCRRTCACSTAMRG